ncbi:MAG: hypothetical protein LRS48_00970 [Desulfurococcales archaeon]|nr:hypothetical protein [Desulfurococcales archaeon]
MSERPKPNTKLGEEVYRYIANFEKYDYLDLENIITNILLNNFKKIKIKNYNNTIRGINEACKIAGFLGTVCTLCKLINTAITLVKPETIVDRAPILVKRAGLLEAMRQRNIQQSITVLADELVQGSTVYALSYSNAIVSLLSGVQFKADTVILRRKEPFRSGILLGEKLRKRKLNVQVLPDEQLGYITTIASVAVGVLIGTTSDGQLIVDAGSLPAIRMLEGQGKKTFLLAHSFTLCPHNVEESLIPRVTFKSSQSGGRVRARSIDIIDPDDVSVYLASENRIVKASREYIVSRHKSLGDTFKEVLNALIT